MEQLVTNWSNFPKIKARQVSFESEEKLKATLNETDHLIARGNGRCYGDASLSKNIVSTVKYNKVLSFDVEQGLFCAQAGILLSEILEIIVPRGWFLPVTPGTKFVTLGGAISADVHGKNHHQEGSFSNHIVHFDIFCADGQVYRCSQNQEEDLFQATCGGNGLTGIVLNAKIQLKKIATSYIRETRIKCNNLEEVCASLNKFSEFTYSVAWIDCLKSGKNRGRSILILGEHATTEELNVKQQRQPLRIPGHKQFNMPFHLPSFVLNSYTIRAFNSYYFHRNLAKEQSRIVNYDSFFYPLDSILNWNRMYGKKGFIQYQFVLPVKNGVEGLGKVLNKISAQKMGSFLAVLKLFGNQESLISFPMEGYTLALDFPINRNLFSFLDQLDDIVADHGGRIYLSKDARQKKELFFQGYPNAELFINKVEKYNPGFKFRSLQSERLSITP